MGSDATAVTSVELAPAAERPAPAYGGGVRAVWTAIAQTSGARVYSLGVGMIAVALTARWLGPAGRGVIAAASTWATLFFTIGYLSLGQVALHEAAATGDDRWLGPSLGSLAAIDVTVTLLGWLVAGGLYVATDGRAFGEHIDPVALAIGFAILPFLVWEQYGSSLLMAVDALPRYNRAVIVGRTVGVLLLALFITVFHWGVRGALLATLIGQVVISTGGTRTLIARAGGSLRASAAAVVRLVKSGLQLHLNAVGAFLFLSADVLMLQYYRGAQETGFYQLGVQLSTVMLVPAQAASMVLYTRIGREGADGAWRSSRSVVLGVTAGMAGASIVAALVAPFVIPLLAGPKFEPSIRIFQLLLLGVVGITFSTVMAPQWIARGFFLQASALSMACGLINVGANMYLIPHYGMMGATWATVGSYTIALGTNAVLAIGIDRGQFRGR